jgi:hypothetical protein
MASIAGAMTPAPALKPGPYLKEHRRPRCIGSGRFAVEDCLEYIA